MSSGGCKEAPIRLVTANLLSSQRMKPAESFRNRACIPLYPDRWNGSGPCAVHDET